MSSGNVWAHDADFKIKKENFSAAAEVVRKRAEEIYWIRYSLEGLSNEATFDVIADRCGLDFEYDESGVIGIDFDGVIYDSELEFLKVVAPVVEKGSYIDMYDDFGYNTRYYYDGESVVEEEGIIAFPSYKLFVVVSQMEDRNTVYAPRAHGVYFSLDGAHEAIPKIVRELKSEHEQTKWTVGFEDGTQYLTNKDDLNERIVIRVCESKFDLRGGSEDE